MFISLYYFCKHTDNLTMIFWLKSMIEFNLTKKNKHKNLKRRLTTGQICLQKFKSFKKKSIYQIFWILFLKKKINSLVMQKMYTHLNQKRGTQRICSCFFKSSLFMQIQPMVIIIGLFKNKNKHEKTNKSGSTLTILIFLYENEEQK